LFWERAPETFQEFVDIAPKGKQYYSAEFERYSLLWYHMGRNEVSKGKTDTYSEKANMLNSFTTWLDLHDHRDFSLQPLCILLHYPSVLLLLQ
jgi:hypothetical protein